MAFAQSHIMAARRHQHSRLIIEVDEYSSNPTQAFTFYNINQGRFQPPHVQMVDPVPHDAPKPPGYTRFVCISDTHSRTDPIQMPYGDVLIHAGDFTELGLPSEVKKFNEWLECSKACRCHTYCSMGAAWLQPVLLCLACQRAVGQILTLHPTEALGTILTWAADKFK
ncbi:Metallophosphoesterase domain-containing protein 1 [Aix galericulata]|nr:Metallophosphoesterase domain-containing protein 1 [Aix galericulata]